ncbi:MAG: hypothetical protein KA738_09560 [Pseudoxanthomonas sp.]|nr:hypothetical protein [Pseudoxanthomonas sp.]
MTLPVAARAQTGATDLASLIECRGDIAGLTALAPALEDPLKAVALGWQPLPQANMFMTEYRLASPIRVFGHGTDHIAFTGSSVMAILDLPDPRPLAGELGLETAIDTPAKAMFGKELRSEESHDAESGQVLIASVVLNVSNVSSHPGKTLVGCSYSLDLPEDAPDTDAPAPEGAPPPASGGQPR